MLQTKLMKKDKHEHTVVTFLNSKVKEKDYIQKRTNYLQWTGTGLVSCNTKVQKTKE